MAARMVNIGEKVRIRHGNHKGKFGKVVKHERSVSQYKIAWGGTIPSRTRLTYVVEIENVGPRRVPGSYLDLI